MPVQSRERGGGRRRRKQDSVHFHESCHTSQSFGFGIGSLLVAIAELLKLVQGVCFLVTFVLAGVGVIALGI